MINPNIIKSRDKLIRAALSILFFPLSITQILITKREDKKYQPPGKMVDTETSQLHALVSGKGEPTIILDAGMGGFSVDWTFVQPELSKFSTVLSYDRAGYGWSKTNEDSVTSEEYVNDLRKLLVKLKLKPPYILVGHSFGGLNMQLFAASFPEEIAGLVLVDSVHEHYYLPEYMSEKRKLNFSKMLRVYKLGYILAPLGIPTISKTTYRFEKTASRISQTSKSQRV